MNSFGGLHVTGNSTAFNITPAAKKYTTGWAAMSAASRHGDLAVVPDADNSRLTLLPGVYLVTANLTVEGQFTSGTSGDAVAEIAALLYRAGSAITGAKGKAHMDDEGEAKQICVSIPVEITEAQRLAGTNYVEVYLDSNESSGNDVIVSEAQFYAVRLA